MKRAVSLLLVLVLILSLAACGADSSAPPKGEYKPAEQEQTQPADDRTGDTLPDDTRPADTEPETTEPETTEPETTEPEDTQPEEDNDFALGTMQGGTYENTYVGYGCTLDENWTYKTAEELQDLSDLTKDLFEQGGVDTSAYSQITDMMAECTDPLATININYTALTTQERIAHRLAGEEGIIDATLQQKDDLIATYAQVGIEVSAMEKVSVTFCGEQRWAIHTTAVIQGVPYYILQMFETNIGPYFATLTLGAFVEDTTPELLELFYSLD